MSRKEAAAIAGNLSAPSKMPGHGYGLPAMECITGTRLRAVEGSTCSGCYAMKGRYVFPNVKGAMYKRLAAIEDPQWADAMVTLISLAESPFHGGRKATGYFRWHDSGDLQSVEHFRLICEVAERTPDVRHWLPTRETAILRDALKQGVVVPENLTVRISAHMVGHAPKNPPLGLPYSTVTRDHADVGDAHYCPSRTQGNVCGDCRACWDPKTLHVSYPIH
jgi:hypothetical protein